MGGLGPVLLALDYVGAFAFALSGALKAARKGMDLFGLVVLAAMTAVGGGTLRDLIIGRPVFWLGNENYLLLSLLAAVAVFALYGVIQRGERLLVILDAVGLAVFTVIGTSKALDAGVGAVGAIALGCMTGVGGGIARDLLAGDVPLILRREIYASASILGATALWAARWFGLPVTASVIICGVVVFVVRMVSVHYGLGLPHPKADAPETSP
jgi:uncharacterized membrane protein YeiH